MELFSASLSKYEFDRFPYLPVPAAAREVSLHEGEDEIVVVYVLPKDGEVVIPTGHC